MILPVSVYNGRKSIETFAFLDPGSAFTLIDKDLAEDLELTGNNEPLSMLCAQGLVASDKQSIVTSFRISARGKKKTFDVCEARTVRNLKLPKGSQDIEALMSTCPQLKGLPLPTFENVTPKILIGVDNSYLLSYENVVERDRNSPVAVKTKLGWCLFGKSRQEESPATGSDHDGKNKAPKATKLTPVQQLTAEIALQEASKPIFDICPPKIARKNSIWNIEKIPSNENAASKKLLEQNLFEEAHTPSPLFLLSHAEDTSFVKPPNLRRTALSIDAEEFYKSPNTPQPRHTASGNSTKFADTERNSRKAIELARCPLIHIILLLLGLFCNKLVAPIWRKLCIATASACLRVKGLKFASINIIQCWKRHWKSIQTNPGHQMLQHQHQESRRLDKI